MPVRIYDISKKLGLENKEVLSKAKKLGITAARVASSSLDKITAEYLEEQLRKDHPNLASATPAHVALPPVVSEPILVVSAPPPPPPAEEPALAIITPSTATATLEAEPPPTETDSVEEVREPIEATAALEPSPLPPPIAKAP